MKNVIVLIACVIVAHLSYSQNSSTVDVDEKSYQTVKIGTQWWMAENLQVVHFNNGDVIPKIKKGLLWKELATPAYSYYDNKKKNKKRYGHLYNWYVVMDSRGVCPTGWHVSTDEDWSVLEKYLGMTNNQVEGWNWRGSNQGIQLKSVGFEGSNTSGFSALGTGYRDPNGKFSHLKEHNDYWTTTPYDNKGNTEGVLRGLTNALPTVVRNFHVPNYGFCVRCVQD